MAQTNTNDYALTADELSSLRAWISFQNAFGVGRKQLSVADAVSYLSGLDRLTDAYCFLVNPKMKALIEQFFSFMSATNDVAEKYFIALYYLFCKNNNVQPPPPDAYTNGEWAQPWISYWDVFAISSIYEWRTPPNGSNRHGAWQSNMHLPSYPRPWGIRLIDLYNAWKINPPADLIDEGVKMNAHLATAAFENAVLQKWTDFPKVAASTAPVWKAQRELVTDMLKEPSLAADGNLLLLHLLIALGTSNVSDQALAQKVAGAPVNSIEYPNDTICNQIIYSSIMYFADPLGYGYTNARLQSFLTDMDAVILGTDPASVAIKRSLSNHMKILRSDASYPMQDPYNPNYGFNTRMSDTLAALDAARSALV